MKFCPNRLVLVIVFFFIFVSHSFALSIDEAYRAIPHRQTLFDVQGSLLLDKEKEYLQKFLYIVDLAMVERVEMLLWLNTGGRKGKIADSYDDVIYRMNASLPPENLKMFQSLVIKAVELQRAYLEDRHSGNDSNSGSFAIHPKVRSASANLRQAYSILINLYPNEIKNNKQAFFDYLCALDFI